MKTKLFLIATSLFFLVAVLFAWRVWSAPREEEREVTLLSYELKSAWGQEAYGPEQKKEAKNPAFFNRLIEGIEVSYSYKFVPERPVKAVETEVELGTVLESVGAWKKDVILVERSKQGGEFTLSFPLDISAIQKMGSQIGAELGTGYSSSAITLKASVHVRAETEAGIVEEDFVQTVKVSPKGAMLEWDRGLGLFQAGFQKGLKWEHQGSFGYAISLRPSLLDAPLAILDSLLSTEEEAGKVSAPEPKPVFFTKLIDSISLSYDYQLLTSTSGIEVSGWGEVWVVVESPGTWRKKVILVPRTEYQGQYSAKFPLNTAELSALAAGVAADIDKEIGTKTATPRVGLEAAVHTKIQRGSQELELDFVQPLELKMGETVLELGGGLSLTRPGQWGRVDFEQRGGFGYRVALKPNSLGLGPIMESVPPQPSTPEQPSAGQVVKSETPQKEPPARLAVSQSYDSKGLERIDMTLSYELAGAKALDKTVQQAEVKGVLKGVGWEESFTLAAASYNKEKFDLTFPLDVSFLYLVIADQEKRTGTASSTYNLAINSKVTTKGETQGHPLEESFEQTLTVKLGKEKVELPELTPQTKTGAITDKVVVTRSLTGTDRMGSLGGVGMSLVLLLYTVSNYWEQRKRRLPPWEIEALGAKRKYREILVDVRTLQGEAGQAVVLMGSLEELVKAAEALLKPVLHQREADKHLYCVIDGQTLYQYTGQAKKPPQTTEEK